MSRDLSLLVPDFLEVIHRVLSECYELGIEMRPYYTLRDPWTQARLWRQSRSLEEIMEAIRKLEHNGAPFLAHVLHAVGSQNGARVTNELPGFSWHQWGEAVDCYWHLDGNAEWSTRKKVTIKDGREINGYRLYGEIAAAAGLTSGGFWSNFVDWPHIQKRSGSVLSDFTWPEIDAEMQSRFGQEAVLPEAASSFETAAVTATAADVDTTEDGFVEVNGDKFCVNGKAFKFLGFNLRALVHYAASYTYGPGYRNNSMLGDDIVQIEQLKLACGFGARVARVFLPHKNATPQDIIGRLEALLASVEGLPEKLYLLPVLTNFYGDVDFYVRGDRGEYDSNHVYYKQQQSNWSLLTPEWYKEGFQRYYQPFVQAVVDRFKNAKRILAWEVGNELSLANVPNMSDPEKFRLLTAFLHQMVRVIGSIDKNHLITAGMTSTAKAWMHTQGHHGERRHLYEPFDFITIHYPRDAPNVFGANTADIDLAKELNKPFIIEEDLVFKQGHQPPPECGHEFDQQNSCGDRFDFFERCLQEWLGHGSDPGRGASGYLVWGFDGADVGDGHPGGIGGRCAPGDWPALRNLFSTYAEDLSNRLTSCG